VPKIIKYHLQQDPIVPNVPTYIAQKGLRYVLQHLTNWWKQPTNWVRMLWGRTPRFRREDAWRVQENPALSLSPYWRFAVPVIAEITSKVATGLGPTSYGKISTCFLVGYSSDIRRARW
jgi:hypothetical protein